MNDLRAILRGILDRPARAAAARERASWRPAPGGSPVLSFAGVLDGKKLLHGGAVKLLHLRDAFPTDPQCFNVLYLVSSSQPAFALDVVRACKDLGIRFVWNQNGVGYPAWAGKDSERHNAPMRALRELADFVVYQSVFCRESAEHFLGPWSGAGEVLVNPVDLEKFCPGDDAPPVSPLRLLALGTQNYEARVVSAIACVQELRDKGIETTLTVAGNLLWPNAESRIAADLERRKLTGHVTLLPAFTQAEAVRLYQNHHIVLHPKYLDPCPTVVIEALACGCPVVGSASGGLPELVPSDCGKLIPVEMDWDRLVTPSGAEFAAAVADILPDLAARSAAARLHAEATFDSRDWVRRHGEIFVSLVS